MRPGLLEGLGDGVLDELAPSLCVAYVTELILHGVMRAGWSYARCEGAAADYFRRLRAELARSHVYLRDELHLVVRDVIRTACVEMALGRWPFTPDDILRSQRLQDAHEGLRFKTDFVGEGR